MCLVLGSGVVSKRSRKWFLFSRERRLKHMTQIDYHQNISLIMIYTAINLTAGFPHYTKVEGSYETFCKWK